jgi:hypothetical protein
VRPEVSYYTLIKHGSLPGSRVSLARLDGNTCSKCVALYTSIGPPICPHHSLCFFAYTDYNMLYLPGQGEQGLSLNIYDIPATPTTVATLATLATLFHIAVARRV